MSRARPTHPRPAPEASAMPHALTFFLTSGERSAVLRALRARARARGERATGPAWRARALLGALGISPSRRKDEHR